MRHWHHYRDAREPAVLATKFVALFKHSPLVPRGLPVLHALPIVSFSPLAAPTGMIGLPVGYGIYEKAV